MPMQSQEHLPRRKAHSSHLSGRRRPGWLLAAAAGLIGLIALAQASCSRCSSPPPPAPAQNAQGNAPMKADATGMPMARKPVIASLREVSRKQVLYWENNGRYGNFQEMVQAGLLDSRFNSSEPHLDDYTFRSEIPADGQNFTIRAIPDDSSQPSYYIGMSGDVFTADGKPVPFEQQ
jgi:hypothetical protein